MKISEMENFSVDELQNFNIHELEMRTKKLLKKAQTDNRQLPLPIIEKLQVLTNSLPQTCNKKSREKMEVSQNFHIRKKRMTTRLPKQPEKRNAIVSIRQP